MKALDDCLIAGVGEYQTVEEERKGVAPGKPENELPPQIVKKLTGQLKCQMLLWGEVSGDQNLQTCHDTVKAFLY